MSFAGKVVVITGASSGIGAAAAVQFATEGAYAVLVGRNTDKLAITSAQCEQHGPKPLTIVADVTSDVDLKRVVSDTIEQFGRIDVLVNNAGMSIFANITDDNAVTTFDTVMATNLRSVVVLTNLAVPYLIESKGNIINISSVCSSVTEKSVGFSYSTSKAGMDHFTRTIALQLSGQGVRVNTINPGPVRTDILVNMGVPKEVEEEIFNQMEKGTALGRASTAEEVAEVIIFLASDKAKSFTGASLFVDNGRSLM